MARTYIEQLEDRIASLVEACPPGVGIALCKAVRDLGIAHDAARDFHPAAFNADGGVDQNGYTRDEHIAIAVARATRMGA